MPSIILLLYGWQIVFHSLNNQQIVALSRLHSKGLLLGQCQCLFTVHHHHTTDYDWNWRTVPYAMCVNVSLCQAVSYIRKQGMLKLVSVYVFVSKTPFCVNTALKNNTPDHFCNSYIIMFHVKGSSRDAQSHDKCDVYWATFPMLQSMHTQTTRMHIKWVHVLPTSGGHANLTNITPLCILNSYAHKSISKCLQLSYQCSVDCNAQLSRRSSPVVWLHWLPTWQNTASPLHWLTKTLVFSLSLEHG